MLYPLTIPFEKLVNGEGFLKQLEWHADGQSTMVVWDLNKEVGQEGMLQAPQSWLAPAVWAYHTINVFDNGEGLITVDVNAYKDAKIVSGAHGFAYLENMRGGDATLSKQERDGGYLRLQVNCYGSPLPTRRASARWLDMVDEQGRDWSFELVRINEGRSGSAHRFSYGFTGFNHLPAGAPNHFGPGGAVVKMDSEANGGGAPPLLVKPRISGVVGLDSRVSEATAQAAQLKPSVTTWSSATEFPSEPVFVARPGGTAEDDGVLLFLGYDTLRRESFMGVLEAETMAEVARVYCGSRCCVSFHGHWIPA